MTRGLPDRQAGAAVSQSAESSEDQRRSSRTNLLLAATLQAGASSAPVRVRNLSERGALIEGDRPPAIGAAIVLKRGEIEAKGSVVWTTANRCGLRFDDPVPVRDWTGGKIPSGGYAGQARVDAIQADFRRNPGAGPLEPAPVSVPAALPDLPARLAGELAYVQRILENIGDELLGEPAVLHRHQAALQGFDLAGQILGHIAAIVVSSDPVAAVNRIGMEDLRARLKRKPSLESDPASI
jgi:hypothetical protein